MDKRVYNGCLSDDLQIYFEKIASLENLLHTKFPESHVTFFPVEEKYQCHICGKPLSGMHKNKIDAINEALNK